MYQKKPWNPYAGRYMHGIFSGRPGSSASSLLTGLVSLWRLDEESGTRVDQVGSLNLTDNNTVLYDTGVIGNASSHVAASNEYLSSSSTSSLSLAQDLTVAAWFKPNGTGNYSVFVKDVSGLARTWAIDTSGSTARFIVINEAVGTSIASIASSITNGQWHLIVGKYTSSSQVPSISVNGSAYTDGSALAGTPQTGNCPLWIGSRFASLNPANGLIDMCAGWERHLTDTELSDYYNSGAGFDPTA